MSISVWLKSPHDKDTATVLIAESEAADLHTTKLLYMLAGNNDRVRQFVFCTRLAIFKRHISFSAGDSGMIGLWLLLGRCRVGIGGWWI